jgi:hypothetical protein
MIRNRIKAHRKVRASDLVPREWNYRVHPELQRAVLAGIYQEVGFARSLLAYELPDGRLKLIDGHLRRDIDPAMAVEVEVLDVNDAEARQLLLTIDPLASLAQQQEQLRERLLAITPTNSADLQAAWRAAADGLLETPHWNLPRDIQDVPEQFVILVTCRDEKHQVELLGRFTNEGLPCKALLSQLPVRQQKGGTLEFWKGGAARGVVPPYYDRPDPVQKSNLTPFFLVLSAFR